MRTPICDRLGIEFPIFAFSHCRDVIAAVSKAGGFGVLGALAYTPDQLEIELSWIDEHVDGMPYGVDFAMPAKYVGKGGGDEAEPRATSTTMIPPSTATSSRSCSTSTACPPLPDDLETGVVKAAGLGVDEEGPGQVEVSLPHPVSMVVNALGPPPPYVVEQAHEHGLLVGGLVGNRQHAERQVAQGVDVIVAQGTEAGGHCGEISTMVLVPEVVDAVGPDVPVLAAGGIGRGRQMAAALALGAQGVWTGSIWLTVAEANTNPIAVEKLLAANSRGTVRSAVDDGQARPPAAHRVDRRVGARRTRPSTLPMPLQGIVFSEAARRCHARRRTASSPGSRWARSSAA